MAKYRKKPELIEAEIYESGMEDGFDCYNVFGGYIGTYDGKDGLPKANCLPFIYSPPSGNLYINKGDYIITENNKRYPVKKEIFEATYELVEE